MDVKYINTQNRNGLNIYDITPKLKSSKESITHINKNTKKYKT